MKKFVLAALAALAIAVPSASAATNLSVVMHDPGCHWFSVDGKNVKTATVHGAVLLANYDEAALKIVGPGGTKFERVGKTVRLSVRGTYRITMVGQAPDDNHLVLTIR